MALPRTPRREVVRGHAEREAGLGRVPDVAQQPGGMDLLVRRVESDEGHGAVVPERAASHTGHWLP